MKKIVTHKEYEDIKRRRNKFLKQKKRDDRVAELEKRVKKLEKLIEQKMEKAEEKKNG